MICGFIFRPSGEGKDRVKELIIGISATYVSVRHLGKCLPMDMLEQGLQVLFSQIRMKGGESLSVTSFKDGLASKFEYKPDRQSRSERQVNAPEGALFCVTASDGGDKFHFNRDLFSESLSEVISANGSSTEREKITLFLNGSAMEIKQVHDTMS